MYAARLQKFQRLLGERVVSGPQTSYPWKIFEQFNYSFELQNRQSRGAHTRHASKSFQRLLGKRVESGHKQTEIKYIM